MQKWMVINKKADFKGIGERYRVDQVTARIMRNRDLIEEEDIRKYLYGTTADFYDPHLMKDADKLIKVLAEKIKQGKSIRVIGDYDIDGVMSSYILRTALCRVSAEVSVQIPDRIKDGYGLNQNLVQEAYDDGVDTIITCDNGIAAIDEIAYAKSLGMTVLVTDHHEIPYEEKDGERIYKQSVADAIVNPHQKECPYPNKDLCGAGVAWKVVCLLYEHFGVPKEEAEDLLENVAFATVGDIMNLQGENRILVKEGLKRIHHSKNLGMRALAAQCDIRLEKIDAYHFGFVLGPCINATGRLDTAKRALELFFCEDAVLAAQIANELVVLNAERKDLTAEGVELAKKAYEEGDMEKDSVLVIYLPNVHESIAGIIAGRIREAYYKPTFILTKGEEGAKGSGRSTEEYSMYEEMCKCQHLFTKFGGHPMAAGLSLPIENIETFRKEINENCTLTEEEQKPKVKIDVPMPVEYTTLDLVRELDLLMPFGKGNPKPVFADKALCVMRMWRLGKNQNVLKFRMKKAGLMGEFEGIYFGDVEEALSYLEEKYGKEAVEKAFSGKENGMSLDMVYMPKINSFRGEENLQFEIQYYR